MKQEQEYVELHDEFFTNAYKNSTLFFFNKKELKYVIDSGRAINVGTLMDSALNKNVSIVVCQTSVVHELMLLDENIMGFVVRNYHRDLNSLDEYPTAFSAFFNHLIACRYIVASDNPIYDMQHSLGISPILIKPKNSLLVLNDDGTTKKIF